MKNVREPIWWIPLTRRIAVWGIALGLEAGAAAFLIVGAGLSLWVDVPPLGHGLRELAIKIARISGTSAASYAFLGALVGAVIAFYAPASEPENLLKSAFFRDVFAQTLKFWALSCVIVWLGLYCFVLFFYAFINPDWLQLANFGLVRILLALSLWRAINRALRATKLNNSL